MLCNWRTRPIIKARHRDLNDRRAIAARSRDRKVGFGYFIVTIWIFRRGRGCGDGFERFICHG
jgi:hypothetical protein